MTFTSIQPFIPSGENFEASKQLFTELGFDIAWDGGDYVGFKKENCSFILQKYNNRSFAENLMINVGVSDVESLLKTIQEKRLQERLGISLYTITLQPYGKELNMIDLAGVCWHFVEPV